MKTTRRVFATSVAAAAYKRILGANDRVGVGFIGYGLIGAQHVHDFKNQKDVDMAAISDCYLPRLDQGATACGGNPKTYRDFRKLIDDKNVQAVVVSTPDHWHALMTMMACAAGKDVYVEKPLTLFVKEGRWMIDVAAKHNRIVQVGTQQRSGRHYQKARGLIRGGHLGKLVSVRMGAYRNVVPGFGSPADSAAPADFDYDMWLGPAPKRPFNSQRGIYHFRWFWDYSGGQMTNLGAHHIDILQWFADVPGPTAVFSNGGRFVLPGPGEVPDVQDALFTYPGFTANYSHREVSAGRRDSSNGLNFYGAKGSMNISRGGFEIFPDMKTDPENAIPRFQGHPGGGPQATNRRPEPWTQAMKEPGSSDEQFDLHVRNFIDCIKSRQKPIASVEGGHQITTACHLANISLRLGRQVRWDAAREEIPGDREANAMLERPYRKPWDQVLRSLLA
ncbi:MAG: Gfo/Idh/MocA family oxidoreductase [Bryobacteraceae bacterium]